MGRRRQSFGETMNIKRIILILSIEAIVLFALAYFGMDIVFEKIRQTAFEAGVEVGRSQSETIILESTHKLQDCEPVVMESIPNRFVTSYLEEGRIFSFSNRDGNFAQLRFGENHQVEIKGSAVENMEWAPIGIPYVFGNDDNKVVISYTDNGTSNIELWWNATYWSTASFDNQ